MKFLLTGSQENIDRLPLEKKAELGLLGNELSINDIARLCCQDEKEQIRYIIALVNLCKKKKIKYYGDINGWEWGGSEGAKQWGEYIENPYPKVKGVMVDMGDPMRTALNNRWCAAPAYCLINKNDFEVYLKSVNQWPITDGLIRFWFGFKRRKYIPSDRPGASMSLALIDDIICEQGIKYLDEMDGCETWGLLVSGKIKNDKIQTLPHHKTSDLIMVDGERINRGDFLKKYNKRFEKV